MQRLSHCSQSEHWNQKIKHNKCLLTKHLIKCFITSSQINTTVCGKKRFQILRQTFDLVSHHDMSI